MSTPAPTELPPRAGASWRTGAAALMLVAVGVHAWMRAEAGLGYPLPWPDEAHFGWTARAVSQGTWVAPELHPDRPLLWMPPGWFLLTGGVFAIVGPTLAAARALSLAAIVATGACLFSASAPSRVTRWAAAILLGLWLVHPETIVLSNVARMEALLLAISTASALALLRGRRRLGLAGLAAAPLVHPNGVAFAALVFVAATSCDAPRRVASRWRGWVLPALVGLGWVGWAVLAVQHPDALRDDLGYQWTRKAGRTAEIRDAWWSLRTVVAVVMVVAASSPRPGRDRRALLAALGLAALAARNFGLEMWYAPYLVFFDLCVALVAIDLVHARSSGSPSFPWRTGLVTAALLAPMPHHHPRAPRAFDFRGMRPHPTPYVTPEELEEVADALASLPAVEVVPHGDAALFLDRPDLRFVDPVRHDPGPRARLYHRSPQHLKRWGRATTPPADAVRLAGDGEFGWWLAPPS